jgi:hypothetical protein
MFMVSSLQYADLPEIAILHEERARMEMIASKFGEIGEVGYLHRLRCWSPFGGPARRKRL